MAFRLFRKREDQEAATNNEPILGEQDALSDILLSSLINGETITREQALTIPAVAGNLDLIAGCIASMPVKLFKVKKGVVEEVEDDPRVPLLNQDTGDTLDGYQFKKAMIEDYLLSTGGYAYIEKYRNEVTGLYYIENEYVVIDYDFQPIHKSYRIFVEDGAYRPYEFIKLLRNTKNGAWGVGILGELNKALQTAYQTQLYQLGLVKTGGNKRGFLKSERRLGEKEIAALKKAWRNLYANNTENVVVLNNGLDFKEAANTSVEMQLNESIDTLGKQIDKIFHISDDFYQTFKLAIYPILKAFETALNRDLLLEKEKGKYFFEFDVKEIVKANIKERYEVYRIAKECGFMTKNEMRQAENMNRIEGLDVVDLGLGAALYDINSHSYYTPNTDTQSELKTLEEESIIDHDNGTERALRYNHNHGNDGKFTTGGGGGSSSGSSKKSSGGKSGGSSSKEAKIKELEEKLNDDTLGLLAKNKIKTELDMIKEDFKGTPEEFVAKKKAEVESKKAESLKKAKEAEEYDKKILAEKQKQYEDYDKYNDDKIKSKPSSEKVADLKDQRKEYNSDKEFEESFTPLYHGGSKESVNELDKNVEVLSVNEKIEKYGDVSGGNIYGLSTATTKSSAETFSESRGNKKVAELYLSKDAKVYDLNGKHIDDLTHKEVNNIVNMGYDAINVGGSENEMRILNPNVIYTKSQIKSAEGKK